MSEQLDRASETVPIEQPPTAVALRRALARADRGVALNVAEIAALLGARGADLSQLCMLAARRRDLRLHSQGRASSISYSPKVFIPLTHLCRDRCHYCTFAQDPASLRAAGRAPFLTITEVVEIAQAGAAAGCKEALFTLGDRPEARWPAAREWLAQAGYDTTVDYLRAAAVAVLEHTGLLPHLNPGVLTWSELQRLRPVAASMGLMLETSATRLFTTPGAVHYGSPDKDPALRLRMIADAGRANIPFTTGVLVGIGETRVELAESLLALAALSREYGHIQEVIVQNFRPKPDTAMRQWPPVDPDSYQAALATARLVMDATVALQAPPNLTDTAELPRLLAAGIDDWGGVSPVTADHVNPERPWPAVVHLQEVTAAAGFTLTQRLAVHPPYQRDPVRWLDPRIRPFVSALADPDGLTQPNTRAGGALWQEPDSYAAFAHVAATVKIEDETGGTGIGIYGDWSAVAARLHAEPTASAMTTKAPAAPVRMSREVKTALALAERDPGALAAAAHADLALALLTAEGEGLAALAALADAVRQDRVGDAVTYVVNRNINFTNVCYTGCRFCAFAQRESDVHAETLSLSQVGAKVDEAVALGATEICMQGGIHPRLPGTAYFDLAREVTTRPVHLHAFSPMEIINGATKSGLSVREWLLAAKEAGLGSIPGTAAEILDDDVRWVLTKGKLPTADWVSVVRTAHQVGLPSTATMMYGHVDQPHHWVAHLRLLRQLQEDTGGFTEFVGLPFVHQNAPVYLAGLARPGPSMRDDLAVTALARLMLAGAIDNIQVSWVKVGEAGAAQLLRAGANDLGGTLMEESISRLAGATHGTSRTVEQLHGIARAAGRPVRERTTLYQPVGSQMANGKSKQKRA